MTTDMVPKPSLAESATFVFQFPDIFFRNTVIKSKKTVLPVPRHFRHSSRYRARNQSIGIFRHPVALLFRSLVDLEFVQQRAEKTIGHGTVEDMPTGQDPDYRSISHFAIPVLLTSDVLNYTPQHCNTLNLSRRQPAVLPSHGGRDVWKRLCLSLPASTL
jgi:hypothetical protein